MRLTTIFARNLRTARDDAKLSQAQLADLACLSRCYIAKLEHEKNSPTLDTVEALAVALQVEAKALLDHELAQNADDLCK